MKSCCCFDLKTGGLILAALSIFNGFMTLLGSFSNGSYFIAGVIGMVVGGFCFYGIKNNRYSYMLPYLAFAWMGIVICVFYLFYIPIDWFGTGHLKRLIIILVDPKTEDEYKEVVAMMGLLYSVLWILMAISTVLGLYFTMVMQNLYKSIKTTERESLPTFQQNYEYKHPTKTAGF